jgi:hypothetical protein
MIKTFEDIEENDNVYFTARKYNDVCLGKAIYLLSEKDSEVTEDIWLIEFNGEVFTVSKQQFKGVKDE